MDAVTFPSVSDVEAPARRKTIRRGNSQNVGADVRDRRLEVETPGAAARETAGDMVQAGVGDLGCLNLGGKVHDALFPSNRHFSMASRLARFPLPRAVDGDPRHAMIKARGHGDGQPPKARAGRTAEAAFTGVTAW
ncbi:hypothetical protein [Streptomyces sp. NPDC051636]|uniref:hypothetical protein n=1 Tax=Streptomyces sp. NPDC051636 TaxID=3365663 RepID=UPI0037A44DE6